MSDDPVQIFVSYARADDLPPPEDVDCDGFVTCLHEQLNYEFQTLGGPRPKIWRDTRRIGQADQFDQKIEDAISQSSLLLVVLSKNWMASDYCSKELKAFAERWKGDGDSGVRERIVVVGKRHVDPDRRPSMLQGQEGFRFYSMDDPDEVGLEREYFARGKVRDRRYYDLVEEMASLLSRRVTHLGAGEVVGRDEAGSVTPPPGVRRPTVYLAKPATDMREAYDRMVTELTGGGYYVVPEPARDIPVDGTAVAVVDQAMAAAELSIHLLGDKPGFAPEGAGPIVGMQLERAAAAMQARAAAGRTFQRIVWAPRILELNGADETAERDPLAMLAKFGTYVAGDSVEGGTLSKFVELVNQRLAKAFAPVVSDLGELAFSGGGGVYVYHQAKDTDFAFDVARALHERNVNPKLPAYEGTDAERVQLHRQYLRECDSIVVCWAAAPDVWAKATSHQLLDWKQLGRTKGFARRGLVAGPPPGLPKKMFVDLFPKDEIDVVVDLTTRERPTPDDLNPLISSS